MPRTISKYGRPLPYFMKYASSYYQKLKLSKSHSNLNKLCWELERWQKQIRYKRTDKSFDWTIMVDESVHVGHDKYCTVESLYRQFCKDIKAVAEENKAADENVRKAAYGKLYDRYRAEVLKACDGNIRVAANAAVTISHEHRSWNRKFPWIVAGAGIVQNIKQVDVTLPIKSESGDLDYLGRKYKMITIPKEEMQFDR